ncbi:hypothetical protein HPP92_028202 [Vanilla planifolia]|uniref:Uncharacterized protein n=1 Tax=Vanilla planifolia TaxID=51239 RepID=A0A835P885_VANPL|nr:hypothetical protein HPP92_028202 [Vanilla planifolia]
MASALNLGEWNRTCELGFTARRENREEPSCSSSLTGSKYAEKGFLELPQHNSTHGYQNGVTPFHHPQKLPRASLVGVSLDFRMEQCSSCLHDRGCIWTRKWNSATIVMHSSTNGTFSCFPCSYISLQLPFPFPFVPAPFGGWNRAWNFPWAANGNVLSPSSSTSTSNCSGHGSPTLGKHSRDATSLGEEKKEKSLWIPKTLRIDDPDAAAKSSIFATLGIKVDEVVMFKSSPSGAEKGGD